LAVHCHDYLAERDGQRHRWHSAAIVRRPILDEFDAYCNCIHLTAADRDCYMADGNARHCDNSGSAATGRGCYMANGNAGRRGWHSAAVDGFGGLGYHDTGYGDGRNTEAASIDSDLGDRDA
jgi:hypothetical protein